MRKSTSDDPLASERLGMVLWPPPAPLLPCAALPATHVHSSSLGRPHLFQQGAPEAAFASSVTLQCSKRSPPHRAYEEQTDSGQRRTEGKKQPSGLRSVAGIGPRNEQRLVSKGICSVNILAHVFNQQKQRDEDMMLTFLQVDSHNNGTFRHLPTPPLWITALFCRVRETLA